MPDSDEILLRSCAAGNESAFTELAGRHLDAMHAYLAQRCPRWHVVEEVAQEALVRAWQGADSFQGGSAVRTWLIGIARNALSERLRAEPRHIASLDTLLADPLLSESAAPTVDERSTLMRRCLKRVPSRSLALLTARYQEGRPINELARAYKKNAVALARELQRLAAAVRSCVERSTL